VRGRLGIYLVLCLRHGGIEGVFVRGSGGGAGAVVGVPAGVICDEGSALGGDEGWPFLCMVGRCGVGDGGGEYALCAVVGGSSADERVVGGEIVGGHLVMWKRDAGLVAAD